MITILLLKSSQISICVENDSWPYEDQARIQEFSSGGGGVQPSEKFWQAKKKKTPTKGGEGGGLQYLFCFSMVVDIPRCFLQAKTHSGWLFKLCKIGKCVIYVTVGGGGAGVLPQKFLVLNGVKSCVLDKINIEMARSWKPAIVCMTGERITILNLEVIRIFQIFTLCIILASGESQKKIIKIR